MVDIFDPIAVRRKIHSNPELGYQENETTDMICGYLEKWKVTYKKNIAKTGAIAELKKGSGPSIALRADIDALPITEETNLDFSSKKSGLMHACGHDLHTTILLGAVNDLRNKDFLGTIKFIFQPSEEGVYDEGKSGGQQVVESGYLDNVSTALGLHVFPELPVGKVVYIPGQAMGNVNFFEIYIKGEAAHAGLEPEKGKDSIIIATQLIQQAQLIVSRLTSQTEPTIISFTQINGGVNQNIVAPDVTIKGTIRAFDKTRMIF